MTDERFNYLKAMSDKLSWKADLMKCGIQQAEESGDMELHNRFSNAWFFYHRLNSLVWLKIDFERFLEEA